MKKSNMFSPEVRKRAVRMVQERRGEYPLLWAAIESIASKIGCMPLVDVNYPGRWKRGVNSMTYVVERAFRPGGACPAGAARRR